MNDFSSRKKSPDFFCCPVWFVSSLSFWKRNADLIPKTRKTVLSKQVFVPKRGKKKCEHFFLFVNYLNQRNLPPATLVSKEKKTVLDRVFSKSSCRFSREVAEVQVVLSLIEAKLVGS
jgi:hypothetical protein